MSPSRPLNDLNPTGRFSNRAANYAKYRPSYPPELTGFLEELIGPPKGKQIADIGSGTGIFSELLLLKGYTVTGVEPNAAMRSEAEWRLTAYERFYSVDGRAEQTGLTSHSIDLITVAQAFHWMDPPACIKEFSRILKSGGDGGGGGGGRIALIWNLRLHNTSFLRDYEDFILQFGEGYDAANRIDEEAIRGLFAPRAMELRIFSNTRLMDFEALKGLALSASYMPAEGHPRYEEMMNRLEALFATHQESGMVCMEYETKLFHN